MQVLGFLLLLPDGSSIPLPWWHRAPLGLIHDTTVHIALTEAGDRPVGDLIVSVLDCGKWPWMIQVKCQHKDEPGVLAKAFATISPLNIALAEWSNSLGLNAPHFSSGPEGFDPDNESSIVKIVTEWIDSWSSSKANS